MDYKKRDFVSWLRGLWRERQQVVIAAIVLFVGLPIVIGAALIFKDRPSPVVNKAIEQADAATNDGDYAEAYGKLKAAEKDAATKEQKVALYNDLAAAATNVDKLEEAIGYYNLKHQIDPSTAGGDAELLAALYERTGNEAEALAQYKLALAYYESLPNSLGNDGREFSLREVIRNMEAGGDE